MPYLRPSLTTLRDQAIEDITTSGIPNLAGLLRNAVLRVLAWVEAGLAYSLYGYLDWIARQAVPFTSTDEYLLAWAALIGIYPRDSTAATGHARFFGTPGVALPVGAALTRQDGTPYTTTAEAEVDETGFVTVPIEAAIRGAATNCDDGTPIGIDNPVAGINAGGVTVGPTTSGADQETQDALRTRMLAKYRAPPQGGAAGDYQQWALEVPGCSRAWVQGQGYGPGSVIVRVMFDDAEAAHGGFPQGEDGSASDETRAPHASGDQLAVADHIWPLQPVTALVYVMAPVAAPIDVTLLGLSPDTEEIRDRITGALTDMFLTTAQIGGTIYPSELYEAILATSGLQHFTMSQPELPITVPPGALPVMGTLTVQSMQPL